MDQSQLRKPLRDVLYEVLNSTHPDEGLRCYFSPPQDCEMTYPCIVYNLEPGSDRYADNIKYYSYDRYSVTIIDEDPDSKIYKAFLLLPYCRFDRFFVVDGLNHFLFTLFYKGPRIKEENEDVED